MLDTSIRKATFALLSKDTRNRLRWRQNIKSVMTATRRGDATMPTGYAIVRLDVFPNEADEDLVNSRPEWPKVLRSCAGIRVHVLRVVSSAETAEAEVRRLNSLPERRNVYFWTGTTIDDDVIGDN